MGIRRVDNPCVPVLKSFPKLMKNKVTRSIAIFSVQGVGSTPKGVLICSDNDKAIGYTYDLHAEWEDYNEPLTLQNE